MQPELISLPVTSIYAALLGFIFFAITMRVAQYRRKNRLSLGDGGDKAFATIVRGHGNFIETVPIALILILLLELQSASTIVLHLLGIALVCGRVFHYLQLTGTVKPLIFRVIGMVLTLSTVLVAALLLLTGLH